MKNRYVKIVFGICIIFLGISFFYVAPSRNSARADVGAGLQEEYQPLAPLPAKFFEDFTPGGSGMNNMYDLPNYLSGMFKILLALAGLLAVVMIVIGGIEYMSTDAISGKSEGKERITNAVLGLLLALVSWLLLYTINPKLLEFNFNAGNPVTPRSSGTQIIDSNTNNPNQNPSLNPTVPDTTIYDNPNGTGSSIING